MKLNNDWIVGFVDGEGCFYVGINRSEAVAVGYQVLPEFRIVQHKRDIKLLYAIRSFFGCGLVVPNKSKDGDVFEYRVRGHTALSRFIVPFFEMNTLHTAKKFNFLIFRDVVHKMSEGRHLTVEGLEEIRKLKGRMSRLGQIKIESDLSSDAE